MYFDNITEDHIKKKSQDGLNIARTIWNILGMFGIGYFALGYFVSHFSNCRGVVELCALSVLLVNHYHHCYDYNHLIIIIIVSIIIDIFVISKVNFDIR